MRSLAGIEESRCTQLYIMTLLPMSARVTQKHLTLALTKARLESTNAQPGSKTQPYCIVYTSFAVVLAFPSAARLTVLSFGCCWISWADTCTKTDEPWSRGSETVRLVHKRRACCRRVSRQRLLMVGTLGFVLGVWHNAFVGTCVAKTVRAGPVSRCYPFLLADSLYHETFL